MTPQDAPLFLARLNILAELFDAKFSEAKQQLYFEALSDLDLEDLQRAIQDAARQCKFMPKPVELRELAVGREEDHAEEAWFEFKADIRRIGQYQAWDTPDTSAKQAVSEVFGGFSRACAAELTPEMWQARKKEFIRAYIGWERHTARQRQLPAGTAEPKLLT